MRFRYEITASHNGLGRQRVLRGDDLSILHERGNALCRSWNETYARQRAAEERRQSVRDRKLELETAQDEAEERTCDAQAALQACRSLLAATIGIDDTVDFETFKRADAFEPSEPTPLYKLIPNAPPADAADFQPSLGLFDKLIPALRRKREAEARDKFDVATRAWQRKCEELNDENQQIYADVCARHAAWLGEKQAFESKQAAHNAAIDVRQQAYLARQPRAVLEYCDLVLTRSAYPDFFPKEFSLDFREDAAALVVDYTLPDFASLPRLEEVRYQRTKGEFTEKFLTQSEAQRLYADVLAKVCLRTIHELFEADRAEALDTVVFNGWVRATSAATGRLEASCLVTLLARKEAFLALNLAKVDPRLCLEQLSGRLSAKPHQLTSVQPLAAATEETATVPPVWAVELDRRIAASPTGDIAFIGVADLRRLLGLPEEDRSSVSSSGGLVVAVHLAGYCVEPDAAATGGAYKSGDEVAVFKFPGRLATHPTAGYLGAAALLQLFHLVAYADGRLDPEEESAMRAQVAAALGGDPVDELRLRALGLLINRQPRLASANLSKVVRRLAPERRLEVAHALLGLAALDGLITESERSALQRIFTTLELPSTTLDRIWPGAVFAESTILPATTEPPGEDIPPPPPARDVQPARPSAKPIFALDAARIAAISRETREVVKLLSYVLAGPEPEVPAPATAAPSSTAPVSSQTASRWDLAGLDPLYHALTAELFEHDTWTQADFAALATRHHLMPMAIVETLNAWADEQLGDFLLDGENPLTLRRELLRTPS